jgi:hypothetical protein
LHTFGGLLEKLRRGGRLATPLRFLVKQYAIRVFREGKRGKIFAAHN